MFNKHILENGEHTYNHDQLIMLMTIFEPPLVSIVIIIVITIIIITIIINNR